MEELFKGQAFCTLVSADRQAGKTVEARAAPPLLDEVGNLFRRLLGQCTNGNLKEEAVRGRAGSFLKGLQVC